MNSTFWSQTTGNVSFWDFLWNVKLSRHPSFFPDSFRTCDFAGPGFEPKIRQKLEARSDNEPRCQTTFVAAATCCHFWGLIPFFHFAVSNVDQKMSIIPIGLRSKKLRKIVRKFFVNVRFFSFLAQAWWRNDLCCLFWKAVFWKFSVLVKFLLLNRLGFRKWSSFFVAFRFESNK